MEPSKNRHCHNSAINLDPMNSWISWSKGMKLCGIPTAIITCVQTNRGFAPKLWGLRSNNLLTFLKPTNQLGRGHNSSFMSLSLISSWWLQPMGWHCWDLPNMGWKLFHKYMDPHPTGEGAANPRLAFGALPPLPPKKHTSHSITVLRRHTRTHVRNICL